MSFPTDPLIFNQVKNRQGLGFDFTAGTALWLMVDRTLWTPDPDEDFIATILFDGAVEWGTRQPISNPTVTLDDAGDRSLWGADDFTFPGIPNGQAFDTAVLANLVTNDGDSWLMGAWDLGAQTGDGNPINVNITGGYLFAWP